MRIPDEVRAGVTAARERGLDAERTDLEVSGGATGISAGAADPTRRDFLAKSGGAFGGLWLMRFAPVIAATQACASEARESGADFAIFTPSEARAFEAFAARMIPTDETPGATEAGAVYFADRALETFLSDVLPLVRGGLAGLDERVAAEHAGVEAFADLPEADQDAQMAATEQADPAFFFFGRVLVTLSLVSNPSYGGNRNEVGWELIGFEPTFGYTPPFGHYDRDEHGTTASGEEAP